MNIKYDLLASERLMYSLNVVDGLQALLNKAHAKYKEASSISIDLLNCKSLASSINPSSDLIGVMYHIPINQSKENDGIIIGSFDVPYIKQEKIDHLRIVGKSLESFLSHGSDRQVVLFTSVDFWDQLNLAPNFKERVIPFFPQTDPQQPMYSRAKCYTSLAYSGLVKGRCVFFDSDVLILKDVNELMHIFDCAVLLSYRYSPNLMPINEGFFVCDFSRQEAIDFMLSYFSTYNLIVSDPWFQSIIRNDPKVWRGGQLSLNAQTGHGMCIDFRDSTASTIYLPCTEVNYSISSNELKMDNLITLLQKKYAIHVKGNAKYGDLSSLFHCVDSLLSLL